jgi:LysR family transcriptional regulator, transcriptional activator of nhaA
MEWLNYHHLFYFWMVVRAGSIHKASVELRISPPAISTQLKILEDNLGEQLLVRSGRRLILTEVGTTVFDYADDIFSLGRELMDVVKNRPIGRPLHLDVGVVDVMPKIAVQLLLEPAFHLPQPVRIACREASADQLLARLATHELDVVLSDSPVDPALKIRAYGRLLGECGITFAATSRAARRLKGRFPECLNAIPMLLPTENTALRKNLNFWFESRAIRPTIVGEFEDYALLRAFGLTGTGVFPVPSIFKRQIQNEGRVRIVGSTDEVRCYFYAISAERKIQHPAVVAICNTARQELFRLDTKSSGQAR